ncbi:MAG: hypothetical protein ACYS8K_08420 [Planctomycetota bacterium]
MKLQTTTATWLAFSAVTAVWMISALIAAWRDERVELKWRVLPLSVFGFAWLAFGVTFILRFVTIAANPLLFRASRFPPWLIPARAHTRAWGFLGVYWCAFCVGLALVVWLLPRRAPRFLRRTDLLDEPRNIPTLDLLACATAAALVLGWRVRLPAGLTTPLGHFSALWVIPATIGWHMHFRGTRIGVRRFLYMVPGVLFFMMSPYREHILTVFLCVALPALQRKHHLGALRLVGLSLMVLIASTVVLYVYRPVRWQGRKLSTTSQYTNWQLWRGQPELAPWTKLSVRFHGYDSAVLTTWLVPDTFPREERDLIAELLVSAFVPRSLYPDKAFVQRGRIFSTSIWAYDERGRTEQRVSAMISPSMPGDLWAAGALPTLLGGALCWGALIGLLECMRRAMKEAPAAALMVFLAFRIAGGVERDFVHAAATTIQVLVVLLLVLAVVPLRPRRAPVPAPGPRQAPEPEMS